MERRQSKVKVAIRVRPPLNEADKMCVGVDESSVQIFNHRNIKENIQYDFSAVYGMGSSQQQVYSEVVKPLIPCAVQGQNLSIFAYGPTGTGKTHTMLGTSSDPGIIPRVINGLFQSIDEETQDPGNKSKITVSFSYLEIYNEKVQDLLEPSKTDLPIREDADKNILVPGLAKKEITNFEEFKLAFSPASNNRTVAATKLNNRSSRSHSILLLNVLNSRPCKQLHGKIYLIDLAGSEDNRRTGNKGIRLKESGAINKSLFALGEVVDAINAGMPRIPYRNSKLTRLLQDSVGGSCHSVMITNIAPEERHYYDTYCTLNFATKSKKIVNNTCTRETITKPTVPVVRKAPPQPDLPEEENRTKRQKLTQLEAKTPPPSQDPVPMLSPLMRRQAMLEETVNKRLEVMESNLLRQISSLNPGGPPLPTHPGDQTPKTKAIEAMQKQLAESYAQLQELASRHAVPPPHSIPPPHFIPPPTGVVSKAVQPVVLKDKTNEPPKQRAPEKGRPLCGIKRRKQEEFTCSPLFVVPKKVFKQGFKSSASGSSLKEMATKSEDGPCTDNFNPALQQNRNEEFLQLLNSSSIKDLQNLQTIGAKRAKLIYDWRETYGYFSHCDELKKIPGFTEKYVQKLFHSNLITAS